MDGANSTSRIGRCLLAAASGFLFTVFLLGSLTAAREYQAENWSEGAMRWLALDFWARQFPLEEGLAGASLTLFLALLGETLSWRPLEPFLRLCRFGSRVFGRPMGFLSLLALALIPRGLALSTRPEPTAGAPNVLIVLVDTWRADRSSFLGYDRRTWPGVGSLATSGVVFERAMSQAPWTKPSVGSLFTGLMPSLHGAMSRASEQHSYRFVTLLGKNLTMAEVLASQGYETMGIAMNPNVQPRFGFAQGFRRFRMVPGWKTRDGELIEIAEDWLHRERPQGERPFFLYLHLTNPHFPYDPIPPARGTWERFPEEGKLDYEIVRDFQAGRIQITPKLRQRMSDAYDEELLGTDLVLTPFLEEVRAEYPNTVIVLLGDHGEEFLEHGMIGHGHQLFDESLHVPLVIWAPGIPPARIRTQVRVIDVFPTVLELSGTDPSAWERGLPRGRSLLPLLSGAEGEDRPAPAENGGDEERRDRLRSYCALDHGHPYKLIRQERDARHPRPSFHLYDLENDPGELRDLAGRHPEIVSRLFSRMKEGGWYIAPEDLRGKAFRERLSEEAAAKLRALGYLGSDEEE